MNGSRAAPSAQALEPGCERFDRRVHLLHAQVALGLRPVALPRRGFGLTAGFPAWLAYDYLRRALGERFHVVMAAHVRGSIRPTAVFVPLRPKTGTALANGA